MFVFLSSVNWTLLVSVWKEHHVSSLWEIKVGFGWTRGQFILFVFDVPSKDFIQVSCWMWASSHCVLCWFSFYAVLFLKSQGKLNVNGDECSECHLYKPQISAACRQTFFLMCAFGIANNQRKFNTSLAKRISCKTTATKCSLNIGGNCLHDLCNIGILVIFFFILFIFYWMLVIYFWAL